MAHKSKTQRAKASAARQERKAQAAAAAANPELKEEIASESAEAPKASKDQQKKAEEKPKKKKKRFQFLRDVKAEMKRVTWPTKKDVLRWSLVVVAALLFFGVYVAVLDNIIVTPLLVAVSGLGA